MFTNALILCQTLTIYSLHPGESSLVVHRDQGGKIRELNVYLLLPPFLNIVFLDIQMEYNIRMYVEIF